jgi:nitroreductase
MKGKNFWKVAIILSGVIVFGSIPALSVVGDPISSIKDIDSTLVGVEYLLPPPQVMSMGFEESVMRRMSMRNFTDEPVTDEELATVLWAAYGLREDGNLTVPEINGVHAGVLYVLLEDVYTYHPGNHSLVFYKEGDYRDVVGWQHDAPVQLGLCWNMDVADANLGSAELGALGQNIYFAANALGLGTVITAQGDPSAMVPVGLPANEHGMGVMPLGHVRFEYDFLYRPLLFSFLPRIEFLTTVLEERAEVMVWEQDAISREELSHLLWASYGYSYYLDRTGSNVVKRHHTVPSAHGYYPFRIYVANSHGVFRFMYGLNNIDIWGLPVVSYLRPVGLQDIRSDIAQATKVYCADAPVQMLVVLDIDLTNQWDDLSADNMRWIWYYEAGAAAHNMLLEATSLGLAGNIETIQDKAAICSLLRLDTEKFDPMLVVPVG